MERIPKGIYPPNFWAEAVRLVEVEKLSADAAAKRLSVPKSRFGKWVRASRTEKVARLQLKTLNEQLFELTDEQAAYISVPKDGPYKTDHYRY